MRISVCIIAYNEEESLPGLLSDVLAQSYPHNLTEVVLVDAMSTDRTLHIMQEFARNATSFERVTVTQNPKKTQPSGWNVAISAATGDAIIRVDAHAHIPCDFVANHVRCLEDGENISGGPRPNLILNPTPWKETLLLAESSMFGSGIASYRRTTQNERRYVNTMFHAAYRREVFEKAGVFNENLIRTEDNELHYRMRKAGYRFCFDPSIVSYQHTRSTLPKMLKQKFQNGYWIGLTAFVCPGCLSLFHFVPFAFVLAILLTTILAVFWSAIPAALLWSAYGLVNIAMSLLTIVSAVSAARKEKKKTGLTMLALPVLFLLLHISYGIGTLLGVLSFPLKTLGGWNPES